MRRSASLYDCTSPQRALDFAAVHSRRKLWNNARGRHCGISGRSRNLVQRHHAAFDGAEFRDAGGKPHQRSALRFSDSLVHYRLPDIITSWRRDLAQDMTKARQEAEQWASTDYAQALDKGDALTPQERQKIIDQLARFTGLSKEVIDEANLRINVQQVYALPSDRSESAGWATGRALHRADPNGPAGHAVLRSHRLGHAAAVYVRVQQLSSHRA